MKHLETQKQAIADYLLCGLPLTPYEAIKLFGCTKLSSRLGELEREGRIPRVTREWKEVKTRYCDKVKIRSYQIKPRLK